MGSRAARRIFTLSLFAVVGLLAGEARADKTCREFTDAGEIDQWTVENLTVIGPQGANGGVALFSTTGQDPQRLTSPTLDYTTLPNQIWYLCQAIYYVAPNFSGTISIRWEYRLQGAQDFQTFMTTDSLVAPLDPNKCELTFDISAFFEDAGINAGSVIEQVRFTLLNAPAGVTFGLRGFCFADPDYNYRGLHAHDPTEVPWCGQICTDSPDACQPGQTPECQAASDCPQAESCVGGRCEQSCTPNGSCATETLVCNQGTGTCAPPCNSNLDCYQQEICDKTNPAGAICVPRNPGDVSPGTPGTGGTPGSGTPGSGPPGSGTPGSGPPGSGTPGTGGTPGAPCQGDHDCSLGQRCVSGACTPPSGPNGLPNPICTSDGDCQNGLVCLYHQCVVPPGTPCQGDHQCSFGERCISGACTPPTSENPPCGSDNSCPTGLSCVQGQCVTPPGTACQGDHQCSFGQRCASGRCNNPSFQAPCQGDLDCGVGLVCEGGTCQAPPTTQCTYDEACSGLVCIGGRCQLPPGGPCQGDTQCSHGARCISGRCTAPLPPGNRCQDDGQCAIGSFCIDSVCKRPCEYDAHCLGSDRCVGGFCQPADYCVAQGTVAPTNQQEGEGDVLCAGLINCTVNGEPTTRPGGATPQAPSCQPGDVCTDGKCQRQPHMCMSGRDCEPGDECGGAGTCQHAPGACQKNEDCTTGDVCIDGWCGRTCHDLVGDSGLHIAVGCAPGEVCQDGRCEPPCSSDSDCSAGYVCRSGACRPSFEDAEERVRPNGDNAGSMGGACNAAPGAPSASASGAALLGLLGLVGLLWPRRRPVRRPERRAVR